MEYLGRAVGLEGISETMTGEASQLDQVATVRGASRMDMTKFNSQITLRTRPSFILPPSKWLFLCQSAKDRKQPSRSIIFEAYELYSSAL